MGHQMQVGYEQVAIFDQYLASLRVNSATVRYCRQSATEPWKVGDTHYW